MKNSFLLNMLLLLMTFNLFAQDISNTDIAHIGVTANQIDIDYANLALKKSKNSEVKRFAKMMATDHKAVIEQAVQLVTKLGVTPTDNDVSKSLMKGAKKKLKELSKLKGHDFDKAYINNEVEYHKAVIATIKTTLIPKATSQELKAFLQALIAPLETHLHHAQMAQKKILNN